MQTRKQILSFTVGAALIAIGLGVAMVIIQLAFFNDPTIIWFLKTVP